MGLCLSPVVAMTFLSHLETTKILKERNGFCSGKIIYKSVRYIHNCLHASL